MLFEVAPPPRHPSARRTAARVRPCAAGSAAPCRRRRSESPASAQRRRACAGSAVASARITNGASRPLAPCTVITRTALAGADGSRLISTSPRVEPGEEAVERGGFRALELQRARQQFLDRVARRLPEPAVELAPPVERAGQDRLEEPRGVVKSAIASSEPSSSRARGKCGRSSARSRKRAPQRPLRPWASSNNWSWLQPISGETSKLARLRSSSGWTAKAIAASRSLTASGL